MPFQFHRSFGATASPPAPRLGPSFSRRRASSTTTSTGVMWVRILQAFSREYQPPGRDSLSGSTKRWIGTTACVPPGKCAVIIRRWSGGTRKRSVVGPPVVVAIQHSGVPLQPTGQLPGAEAVLGERTLYASLGSSPSLLLLNLRLEDFIHTLF